MIAEFDKKPFGISTFGIKVDYHNGKIEQGKGSLLYSSIDCTGMNDFRDIATQVATLNDRVKYPYHEVSINLPKGESLDDGKFVELANEFMQKMKYDNTAYSIIRHTDKDHEHVHVLFTTVDLNGKKIDRFNERLNSQKISRELEKKHGLKITVYNKFDKDKFSEIKAREYYFHNALVKGLKSYQYKSDLDEKVKGTMLSDLKARSLTNSECELILGSDLYNEVGEVLEKGKFFNSLYKDELLSIMDACFSSSNSLAEFKKQLEDQGVYMRLVSEKGVSKYVYGLPNVPIYFKDTAVPKKYRYTEVPFENQMPKQPGAGEQTPEIPEPNGIKEKQLSPDEQKHLIYNFVFISLGESQNYEEFKNKLKDNILIEEHKNTNGIYGLSFSLLTVDDPVTFKASDISKHLSYSAINKHYQEMETPISKVVESPEVVLEMKEDLSRRYMPFMAVPIAALFLSSGSSRDDEQELEQDAEEADKKKKKKKRMRRNRDRGRIE